MLSDDVFEWLELCSISMLVSIVDSLISSVMVRDLFLVAMLFRWKYDASISIVGWSTCISILASFSFTIGAFVKRRSRLLSLLPLFAAGGSGGRGEIEDELKNGLPPNRNGFNSTCNGIDDGLPSSDAQWSGGSLWGPWFPCCCSCCCPLFAEEGILPLLLPAKCRKDGFRSLLLLALKR